MRLLWNRVDSLENDRGKTSETSKDWEGFRETVNSRCMELQEQIQAMRTYITDQLDEQARDLDARAWEMGREQRAALDEELSGLCRDRVTLEDRQAELENDVAEVTANFQRLSEDLRRQLEDLRPFPTAASPVKTRVQPCTPPTSTKDKGTPAARSATQTYSGPVGALLAEKFSCNYQEEHVLSVLGALRKELAARSGNPGEQYRKLTQWAWNARGADPQHKANVQEMMRRMLSEFGLKPEEG